MKKKIAIFCITALCLTACGRTQTTNSGEASSASRAVATATPTIESSVEKSAASTVEESSEAETEETVEESAEETMESTTPESSEASTKATDIGSSNDSSESAAESTAATPAPTVQEAAPETPSRPTGTIIGYNVNVPDGFTASEAEGTVLYYAAADGSSISLNVQGKDPAFSSLTPEMLSATFKQAYFNSFGVDITITDLYFTTDLISGYPSYQYAFTASYADISYSLLIVGIDADNTYIITCTDVTGGGWMESFKNCVNSIQLITG